MEEESRNMTTGWVSGSQTRGTLDIIWTCFLVIFTCTWSVLHVNLPTTHESSWQILIRKARWALFTVYAPDAVVLIAACQWQSARISRNQMQEFGVSNWTIGHGFLADSGGLMLSTLDYPPFPINSRAVFYLVSKGYIPAPNWAAKKSGTRASPIVLRKSQLQSKARTL